MTLTILDIDSKLNNIDSYSEDYYRFLREYISQIYKQSYILPKDRIKIDQNEILIEVESLITRLLQSGLNTASIYIIINSAYYHYIERYYVTRTIYKHKVFSFIGNDIDRKKAYSMIFNLIIGDAEVIPAEFNEIGEETCHNAQTTQVVSIIDTYSIKDAVEKYGNYIISGKKIKCQSTWDDHWDNNHPKWTELELLKEELVIKSDDIVNYWGALLILYLRRVSMNTVTVYQFLELEKI